MTVLVLGSLAFIIVHAVPATGLRGMLIGLIGQKGYLGLFSFSSMASVVVMAMGFGDAATQDTAWIASSGLRWTIAVLMIVPFWLAVAANTQRNAAALGGEKVLGSGHAARGVFTVTRHPLMVAIATWSALHLAANPDLPSLVLFGTFLGVALVGAMVQDRRKVRELGGAWQAYLAVTSFVPFGAILAGRTRFDTSDITWWRLLLAIGAWLMVLVGHGAVIGMPAVI